jgi:aryl-alcohol dehydrogenase-like predicted oxidoreductase
LHHVFSDRKRQSLLGAVQQEGITHFDTAPYYGYGLAECDLGKHLRKKRAQVTISTKVGLYPFGPASRRIASVLFRKGVGMIIRRVSAAVMDLEVKRAEESLQGSLSRLRTDYVDFLFLHEPDLSSLLAEETLYWLEREKKRGRIRAWGVAGLDKSIIPLLSQGHPLASVVQTRDSLDIRQADFLASFQRNMQFTYGYLSGDYSTYASAEPAITLRQALERNTTGCLLVSTRSVGHLQSLVSAVR